MTKKKNIHFAVDAIPHNHDVIYDDAIAGLTSNALVSKFDVMKAGGISGQASELTSIVSKIEILYETK